MIAIDYFKKYKIDICKRNKPYLRLQRFNFDHYSKDPTISFYVIIFYKTCDREKYHQDYSSASSNFFYNYLRHTKSSGAGTIIPYRKREEIFSLYILIAQIVIYNSTIFHHSSVDIIIIKFRYVKVRIESMRNGPKNQIP